MRSVGSKACGAVCVSDPVSLVTKTHHGCCSHGQDPPDEPSARTKAAVSTASERGRAGTARVKGRASQGRGVGRRGQR